MAQLHIRLGLHADWAFKNKRHRAARMMQRAGQIERRRRECLAVLLWFGTAGAVRQAGLGVILLEAVAELFKSFLRCPWNVGSGFDRWVARVRMQGDDEIRR